MQTYATSLAPDNEQMHKGRDEGSNLRPGCALVECATTIHDSRLRLAPELRGQSYEETLRELNITTLEEGRNRGYAIATCKILRGFTK